MVIKLLLAKETLVVGLLLGLTRREI